MVTGYGYGYGYGYSYGYCVGDNDHDDVTVIVLMIRNQSGLIILCNINFIMTVPEGGLGSLL